MLLPCHQGNRGVFPFADICASLPTCYWEALRLGSIRSQCKPSTPPGPSLSFHLSALCDLGQATLPLWSHNMISVSADTDGLQSLLCPLPTCQPPAVGN